MLLNSQIPARARSQIDTQNRDLGRTDCHQYQPSPDSHQKGLVLWARQRRAAATSQSRAKFMSEPPHDAVNFWSFRGRYGGLRHNGRSKATAVALRGAVCRALRGGRRALLVFPAHTLITETRCSLSS